MYNLSILFTLVILGVIFNNVVFAVNIYERKNKVNRKIEKYITKENIVKVLFFVSLITMIMFIFKEKLLELDFYYALLVLVLLIKFIIVKLYHLWYNFFGDIMIIDTHCHVLSSEYDNPEYIIEESFKNNVGKIIINGYDLNSSIEAVKLSKKYNNVYAAIGIGPENIEEYSDDIIDKLQNLIDNNKIVAIGEIGLDYYWTNENKEKQIKVFRDMLKLAKVNNLPVIVHSRDAFNDTYNILKEYNIVGIIHCFQGSVETANEYIKLGFLIGIGGVLTFKNAKKLVKVVEELPIESFSTETDSPYLTPEPYRGSKNKPYYVKQVIEKIAEIKSMKIKDVEKSIASNIMSIFDLR